MIKKFEYLVLLIFLTLCVLAAVAFLIYRAYQADIYFANQPELNGVEVVE